MGNTNQANQFNSPTYGELGITSLANEALRGASKWAKILAILSVSMMAVIIVLSSIMAIIMPSALGLSFTTYSGDIYHNILYCGYPFVLLIQVW